MKARRIVVVRFMMIPLRRLIGQNWEGVGTGKGDFRRIQGIHWSTHKLEDEFVGGTRQGYEINML
jgi:hypothetical protein